MKYQWDGHARPRTPMVIGGREYVDIARPEMENLLAQNLGNIAAYVSPSGRRGLGIWNTNDSYQHLLPFRYRILLTMPFLRDTLYAHLASYPLIFQAVSSIFPVTQK